MMLIDWRRLGVVAVVAATAAGVSCDGSDDGDKEFVFTPAPYTVVRAEPDETPVVIGFDETTGGYYFEGGLHVVVPPSVDLEDFVSRLEAVGLTGTRLDPDPKPGDMAIVRVEVPLGGVLTARDLIRTWPGLEFSVNFSYLSAFQLGAFGPEDDASEDIED